MQLLLPVLSLSSGLRAAWPHEALRNWIDSLAGSIARVPLLVSRCERQGPQPNDSYAAMSWWMDWVGKWRTANILKHDYDIWFKTIICSHSGVWFIGSKIMSRLSGPKFIRSSYSSLLWCTSDMKRFVLSAGTISRWLHGESLGASDPHGFAPC